MIRAGSLLLEAPAKVNLGLRIRGRRSDGYHLLESLFVPLDLSDRLRVDVGAVVASAPRRVTLAVSGDRAAGVPGDDSNLAVRAAQAFLAAAGRTDLVVAIQLEKRIPAQAGLGGGSSDAGAVLRALSALVPWAAGPEALAALALHLGADVPFFLEPRPALVTGIGERIEPAPKTPPLVLLLAHPGIGLSTAEVYAAFDALAGALTAREPGPTVRPPEGPLEPEALARLLENDLEPAALRLCPPSCDCGSASPRSGPWRWACPGAGRPCSVSFRTKGRPARPNRRCGGGQDGPRGRRAARSPGSGWSGP